VCSGDAAPAVSGGPAKEQPARVVMLGLTLQCLCAQVMQHPWFREDLPRDCMALNEKLMRMQPSRRAASCRQTEVDITRIGRRMSFDL